MSNIWFSCCIIITYNYIIIGRNWVKGTQNHCVLPLQLLCISNDLKVKS